MRQFHELFAGRDDVYGTYAISKAHELEVGEKQTGKAKTVTGTEVTEALYQAHLDGAQSLGIVPIRPDGTVSWFAIDVDSYANVDLHKALASKINKLNLPLVVFKSKSGGAHLFCFLTEPMTAANARFYAEQYLVALGLPKKTEIFPKQEAIDGSDAGSWINLPYFGNTRRCVGIDGCTELSLKEFLMFASEREVHPSDLGHRANELTHHKTDSSTDNGAPPCIAKMLEDGVEEGGRDNALTHIAVYLKRAYPDDWQDRLCQINDEKIYPSLSAGEIFKIAKSAERKDYQYLCKQSPMVAICDKATCVKRKFGVGDGEGELSNFIIDSIRKVGEEDPYYVVIVDGMPIKLVSSELLQFAKFRKAVFERLDKLIRPMKPSEWDKLINEKMADMEKEDAPEEVSVRGSIISLFMSWTSQRLSGVSGNIERIVDGQPFYTGKAILFRGIDLLSYIRRNSGRPVDDRVIWLTLQEEGAEQKTEKINGRDIKVWAFPISEPWFDIKEDGAF